MGEFHDQEASYYGDLILSKIRAADRDFKQVFTTNLVRTGSWDWPRPDYVCFDESLKVSYALEFKPPAQTKREYLCGLGQSLAYLSQSAYSGLIVPSVADDGYPIAEFIKGTLDAPEFDNVCTSLFAYDPQSRAMEVLRPIKAERKLNSVFARQKDEAKTFWCWWRDMSHYELYELLRLSFVFNDEKGDVYSKCIYPKFYDMMVRGQTKQWNGEPRRKTGSESSRKSEKQNYNIPLVQLGLWSRGEGRLTDLGYTLLRIGQKYGPSSCQFIDAVAYVLLMVGRHLELINIVKKFQDATPPTTTSKNYAIALDNYLTSCGCIGKRKPTAVKTGAKNSYVRDEMKLWNKFGFLMTASDGSYYCKGLGFNFNWQRITDVLTTNRFLSDVLS